MEERESSITSIPEPSRSLFSGRITLRWMLVGIAMLAAWFGYLAFFREARAVVSYEIATIPKSQVDALGIKFNAIEDSPYQWAEVTDFDLTSFTPIDKRLQEPFHAKNEFQVHIWPAQADTYTSTRFVRMPDLSTNLPPAIESTQLGGFWGAQLAGTEQQFRVDVNVAHQYPNFAKTNELGFTPTDDIEGKLFYEGIMPQGDLLFIAPVNQDVYHVVLVHVQPVEKPRNTPEPPNPTAGEKTTVNSN